MAMHANAYFLIDLTSILDQCVGKGRWREDIKGLLCGLVCQ